MHTTEDTKRLVENQKAEDVQRQVQLDKLFAKGYKDAEKLVAASSFKHEAYLNAITGKAEEIFSYYEHGSGGMDLNPPYCHINYDPRKPYPNGSQSWESFYFYLSDQERKAVLATVNKIIVSCFHFKVFYEGSLDSLKFERGNEDELNQMHRAN